MARTISLVASLLALALPAAAQQADSLPAGVTSAMVAEGKKLFAGTGLCAACHGPEGKGVPGLGASLADRRWAHSDGSFDAIVKQVLEGVPADKSTTGVAMPPKGGSQLSDEQVRAVAAYVWTLGRAAAK